MPLFLLFSIKWNPVKRDLSMLSLYYFPSLKSIQPKARIFPAIQHLENPGFFIFYSDEKMLLNQPVLFFSLRYAL